MSPSESFFKPISSVDRLSDKVIEQIKNLIDRDVLKVGDKLPGERDLAHQLSVGRTSIREALRALEALGIIEMSPRGAIIINKMGGVPLSSRWNWVIEGREEEIRNYFEVREVLEPRAAALAAARVNEEEIRLIRATVETMEQGIAHEDIALIVSADMEFHNRIAAATKNAMFVDIYKLISQVLLESRYAIFDIPGRAEESCQHHRVISEAIRRGDSEAAASEMAHHIHVVATKLPEYLAQYRLKMKAALPMQDPLHGSGV